MKCVQDTPTTSLRVPRVRLYCEPGQAAVVVFTELGWIDDEARLCVAIGSLAGLFLVHANLEFGADPDRLAVVVERLERFGAEFPTVTTYHRIEFAGFNPRHGFLKPRPVPVSRAHVEELIGAKLDTSPQGEPECGGV